MMNKPYEPNQLEAQLQKEWDENQTFVASEDLNKEKFYCLSQFPYPSGNLHMGHVRVYTIGDVIARQQRKRGKNVLQPMGWDAFGLPAENAAIKHKTPPSEWTYQNIDRMRAQLKRLGCAYDWSRELASCDPDYYHWEQWLFIKMLEKGMVYRKKATVNWDPVDQTVLANEQVINGRGWRSDALVEQREIPQWFLKITDYADELIDELDNLPNWPEQLKTMQRNWIGRSRGANITFKLQKSRQAVACFTTRPDTLYGCTYVAIAPSHPLALKAAEKNASLKQFIDDCKETVTEADFATKEKCGMDTGLLAMHPVTQETVPVWVANFVLANYGPGAIMCVPAHDQRDYEFAQKYQLPLKQVIQPEKEAECDLTQSAYTGTGVLIHSENFNGLGADVAKLAITQTLVENKKGEEKINFRLRDWGISRQRYWGTPIPIINCDKCGHVPVPEEDLPVKLPTNVTVTGDGSPLARMPEFYETTCPSCGKPAKRETDTFDTFFESSWYFTRFACKGLTKAMTDDRVKYWMPIDAYVGGIEHAVLHLLYSRYIYKAMRDLGLVQESEPFLKLIPQGMVLKDGSKMSKSKGNVVDPDQLIEKYGADTIRLFIIFTAPPEQSLEWSDSGVEGAHRFLKKVWAFSHEQKKLIQTENTAENANAQATLDWEKAAEATRADRREIHLLLQSALNDYERLQLNTVTSTAMKLLNLLLTLPEKLSGDDKLYYQALIAEGVKILLSLLNPITPHITQALWCMLTFNEDITDAAWPKVNKSALVRNEIELVVQVNGKLRSHIRVSATADKPTIENLALSDSKTQSFTEGKVVKKIIVVPNRLVNIVVGDN